MHGKGLCKHRESEQYIVFAILLFAIACAKSDQISNTSTEVIQSTLLLYTGAEQD